MTGEVTLIPLSKEGEVILERLEDTSTFLSYRRQDRKRFYRWEDAGARDEHLAAALERVSHDWREHLARGD